jgi:hypothetical protein
MAEHDVELALMRAELDAVKLALDAQSQQLAKLVDAWQTASGLLSVVKFLAIVGAGIVAVVAYFKTGAR